jgi:hypothetical protein
MGTKDNTYIETYTDKKNLIFLLAWIVYLLSMGFENTSFRISADAILQYMRYAAYALCVVKIVLTKHYDKKGMLLFAFFFFIALVQSFVTGKREICFMLLFLLAAYGVNVSQIFLAQCLTQMFCLLTVWGLCACGLLENLEFYDHGTIRYSMGFIYVSNACFLFFSLEAAWLYFRRKEMKLLEILIILVIWGAIYYATDTRTMTILGLIMALMCYLVRFWNRSWKNTFTKWVCILLSPCIVIFTWLLQFYYNRHSTTKWMVRLNSALNGRLRLAKQAMENYSVRLFGQKITWVGNTVNLNRNKYNFVDCAYIKILLDWGILISILFLILYMYLMYYFWKKEVMEGCMIVFMFLVCGFMLPVLTNIDVNPFLILAGGMFHGKTKVHQT